MESDILPKMIERLGHLSSEKKRSKGPQNEEKKQVETKRDDLKVMKSIFQP